MWRTSSGGSILTKSICKTGMRRSTKFAILDVGSVRTNLYAISVVKFVRYRGKTGGKKEGNEKRKKKEKKLKLGIMIDGQRCSFSDYKRCSETYLLGPNHPVSSSSPVKSAGHRSIENAFCSSSHLQSVYPHYIPHRP